MPHQPHHQPALIIVWPPMGTMTQPVSKAGQIVVVNVLNRERCGLMGLILPVIDLVVNSKDDRLDFCDLKLLDSTGFDSTDQKKKCFAVVHCLLFVVVSVAQIVRQYTRC